MKPRPPLAQERPTKPLTLLVLKDHSIYAVTEYWKEGDRVCYVTSYGSQNCRQPRPARCGIQQEAERRAERQVRTVSFFRINSLFGPGHGDPRVIHMPGGCSLPAVTITTLGCASYFAPAHNECPTFTRSFAMKVLSLLLLLLYSSATVPTAAAQVQTPAGVPGQAQRPPTSPGAPDDAQSAPHPITVTEDIQPIVRNFTQWGRWGNRLSRRGNRSR